MSIVKLNSWVTEVEWFTGDDRGKREKKAEARNVYSLYFAVITN